MPKANIIPEDYKIEEDFIDGRTLLIALRQFDIDTSGISISIDVRATSGKHFYLYFHKKIYKTFKGAQKATDRLVAKLIKKWKPVIEQSQELF